MTNKTEYYMSLPYTFELQHNPEEGWFVRVKELPGCMSQGDTAEEAMAMIQEAMELWLEVTLEDGATIPKPRPEEEYSGKFVVRVPRSLHREMVERADREGVSLNQLINVTLAHSTGGSAAPQPAPAEHTAWPGVKAAIQQVLIAAGYAQEAAALDERLFADWADDCLSQVDIALQQGYSEDALRYLASLDNGLKAGSGRSPAIAAFTRTVELLYGQVEAMAQLRQGIVTDLVMRSRISEVAHGQNRLLAQEIIQAERVSYSQTSTAGVRPHQYLDQLLGQAGQKTQW